MRYALATLVPLVLLAGACAPLPTEEAPSEPPAPSSTAQDTRTEPESTDPPKPEPDRAPPPETERAESVEAIEDEGTGTEAIDETAPEEPPTAGERDRPEASEAAASESAPATRPGRTEDGEVSGRIMLTGGDADPSEAVVYFVPREGASSYASDAGKTGEIVTRDKSLSPTVLAVASGSEIRFPNQDPILHNLFSVSAGNDFDLGVYGPEEAPSVTFEQPGVVNIYCNVHHDMHAHVLVVDTPFRTRPDSNGNFTLTGLPAGSGELHVWHRQSDRWSRAIKLPASGAFEVSLEVTKPSLPPHRDKTGQSYNRRDRGPYR